MTERIIPVADLRYLQSVPHIPPTLIPATGLLSDQRGRPLRDLRISVTDRCNFRCVYCMPKETFDKDFEFLPHSSLLSFEEVTRVAKSSSRMASRKSGSPAASRCCADVEKLIEMLASLTTLDGKPLDLTMTTNASLLAKKAQSLKDAGLKRVTVSLDSLDDTTFKKMNDVDFPVADVLHGIEVAHQVGLGPVKVNMVVKGGMNDQEIVPMARYFKGSPVILRFIEYMDVGASNGWKMDEVIPSAEVVRRISESMPLEEVEPNYTGETAERWRYRDGSGEVGVISSVTQAFCSDCNRARLSTEGKLFTCLFATGGHDLRALLRKGHSDEEITAAIAHLWAQRDDRYSELRTINTDGLARPVRKVEMSYIGG